MLYTCIQGGPGGILATIDGLAIPMDKWRCAALANHQVDPEVAYPGSLLAGFDDSGWDNAEVRICSFFLHFCNKFSSICHTQIFELLE